VCVCVYSHVDSQRQMVTKATSKADVLAEIEHELHEGAGVQLRIAGPSYEETSTKRAGDTADSDSSDDDDDAPLVLYKKSKHSK
jgi:hypothetical protein